MSSADNSLYINFEKITSKKKSDFIRMRVLWSHKLQQRCEIYSDLFSALPEDCILCVSKAQTSRWISEHADTSKQAFLRLELSFSAVCVRVKFENEFGYFWQEACLEKTFHVHPSSGYIYSHILYIYPYTLLSDSSLFTVCQGVFLAQRCDCHRSDHLSTCC